MVEGLATELLCSLCDEVCKRGAQMKCCGTRACRSCAVLKINKIKKCWNEECGQEDIIPANDLKNDDLLRKAVEHFLKNGKMDPAHVKMLKKTGKNPKEIIGKDGDNKEKKAPVDVVEKFNQPCREGEKCKRKGCLFVHSTPTLADKKAIEKGNGKPCRKGENCTNEKCEFGHPSAPKPCKFGAFCTQKDACRFDHPKTNKPCRFGALCSSQGKSCKFDHTPASKALDRAMSKFKRGIKPMGGDLRFILENKRPMSGGMGGRMASMKMRMRQMEGDAGMRNTNLEQMLKMKEELGSMMANVMGSGRPGSGGMGEGYGMGRPEDRMDGRNFMGRSEDRMDGHNFMGRPEDRMDGRNFMGRPEDRMDGHNFMGRSEDRMNGRNFMGRSMDRMDGMGRSEDRMDGRIWNRGYGGSSGRYHF